MEKVLLFGSIFAFFTFLFPLFLSFDIFADAKIDKLFLSPRLFGFFPLVGGYATVRKEGVYFHFSEKRAKCFLFSDMKENKKGTIVAKAFLPVSVRSTVELGTNDNPVAAILCGMLLQTVFAVLFSVVSQKRSLLKVKNGVILTENAKTLQATLHVVSVFNLLTLTVASVKIIWEGIIELCQTKKKTKPLKI